MLDRIFHKPAAVDENFPGTTVSPSFFMGENPIYKDYEIGEWTYGNPRIHSWDTKTKLRIGKFCSIAEDVTILLGGEHRTDWVTTFPFNILFEDAADFLGHPATKGDVTIGNDVWIGTRSLILSGVTIGDGAVIAADSLVCKNVEPYSIVGGNPANHIKFRFEAHVISALREIAWWNWDIDRIKENWPKLLSPDIEEFIHQQQKTSD
jgi:acetyltransferase-like isoleucine patch superfamily enzyme